MTLAQPRSPSDLCCQMPSGSRRSSWRSFYLFVVLSLLSVSGLGSAVLYSCLFEILLLVRPPCVLLSVTFYLVHSRRSPIRLDSHLTSSQTYDFSIKWRYQQAERVLNKKLANSGPLTTEILWLMVTHSKSTLHILSMLMHLSLGHTTLLGEESEPVTPFTIMPSSQIVSK